MIPTLNRKWFGAREGRSCQAACFNFLSPCDGRITEKFSLVQPSLLESCEVTDWSLAGYVALYQLQVFGSTVFWGKSCAGFLSYSIAVCSSAFSSGLKVNTDARAEAH